MSYHKTPGLARKGRIITTKGLNDGTIQHLDMGLFFTIYTILWVSVCAGAAVVYLADRGSFAFSHRDYWQFLLGPWKIVTFVIAAAALVIVAPYTGDPTWDAVDAGFMSLLTFIGAPWAVGSLYRMAAGKLPRKQAIVVFAVWMFTASWSYDLYIFIRDGRYPLTWFPNIFASSFLYFTAGLLWNLDWKEGKGVVLSFREETWPYVSSTSAFGKIAWFALPLMALVAASIIYFFFFFK